jgi:hypothetical protein
VKVQGSEKPAAKRRHRKSEVLSKKRFFLILGLAALVAFLLAILFWRGFPIGKTILPMFVGFIFLLGTRFSIKTGALNWRGGGQTVRSEKPIAFWFWISVFTLAGLLSIAIGIAKLANLLSRH